MNAGQSPAPGRRIDSSLRLASTIALALIAFVFVSEFPAPSPEGGDLLRR